jgi:hypothetical protein
VVQISFAQHVMLHEEVRRQQSVPHQSGIFSVQHIS